MAAETVGSFFYFLFKQASAHSIIKWHKHLHSILHHEGPEVFTRITISITEMQALLSQ